MNPKIFVFEKNEKGEWYLQLPEWDGDPEDLQMIQGADQWLDLLSSGESNISVQISSSNFDKAEVLTLIRLGEENLGGGGNYYLETYNNNQVKLKLWLCEVTTFIFGDYPQRIYFNVVKS